MRPVRRHAKRRDPLKTKRLRCGLIKRNFKLARYDKKRRIDRTNGQGTQAKFAREVEDRSGLSSWGKKNMCVCVCVREPRYFALFGRGEKGNIRIESTRIEGLLCSVCRTSPTCRFVQGTTYEGRGSTVRGTGGLHTPRARLYTRGDHVHGEKPREHRSRRSVYTRG